MKSFGGFFVTAAGVPQGLDITDSPTFAKITVGAGTSSAPTIVVGTPSSPTGFYAGADQALDLTVANGQRVRWTNSAQYLANSYALASLNDNQADVGLSGNRMRNVFVGTKVVNSGYEEFAQMTAPAAGTAAARLYADTSGGKTRLMVIFPTGAAQQVAIEP